MPEEYTELTIEDPTSSAYEEAVKINSLIDKNIIKPREVADATEIQLTELAGRVSQLIAINITSNPGDDRKKAMTILGLGNPKDKPARLRLLAGGFVLSAYLKSTAHDNFAGLILTGSRVRIRNTPSINSDQDVTFVAQPGVNVLNLGDHDKIVHLAERLLGAPIDWNPLYEHDYTNNSHAPNDYPHIDSDSIVIIPDRRIRKIFMKTFADQLRGPQTDFSGSAFERF